MEVLRGLSGRPTAPGKPPSPLTGSQLWLGLLAGILPLLFLAAWHLGPPMNDSGFYDQPALQHFWHGEFRAPFLEHAFPICGGQLFCAYPPVYPGMVRLWMALFGDGTGGVIWLHALLWSAQAAVVAWVVWRWRLPRLAWWTGAAMVWLTTFQGRPESLALLLGLLPLVVAWETLRTGLRPSPFLSATATLGLVLTFWTSPMSGLLTGFVLGFTWLAALFRHRVDIAGRMLLGGAVGTAVPLVLILFFRPLWWAGFQEHARQTPFATWMAGADPAAWLSTLRHAPGVVVCLALGAVTLALGRRFPGDGPQGRLATLWLGLAAGMAFILLMGFTVVIPNAFFVRGLQPLFVAVTLALAEARLLRRYAAILVVFCLPGWFRLAGMATWGVAAERDYGMEKSESEVMRLLREEPASHPIVISGTYGYASIRAPHPLVCSSDWIEKRPTPWHQTHEALNRIEPLQIMRPALLILSPFDYHRRYRGMIDELERTGVKAERGQLGTVTPPDALGWSRKLLPSLTWAPVVVRLSWPETPPGK